MAANNPQIELETIWGYTKEEVEHRWKIHQKFDLLNRLFGSSSDSDKKAATLQQDNSERMFNALERLFPEVHEENPVEETI